MTLAQYWVIMLKHWKLIIASFLLVGLGALVVSELITPLYQSTTIVQVAIRSGTSQYDYYNSLLASDQLIQTEAVLATSDPVLRQVASHYSGLTVEQLSKEVTATSRVSTQLFEIDVNDPSPTRAAALANDIAATLIQQQLQALQQGGAGGGISLIIAQPAQPALYPVQPKILLNTAAGLVAGLLLGMLLAVLFEELDTRVRTPELLTQLLDWPILATIWRAGSKENVIHPTGQNANVESYRILRTNIGFSEIDKPVHTLVVTSAAPQDGKSVVAANLAIFMAKAGKSTILIDADLRRPTQHEIFGIPAHSMGFSNAILASSESNTSHPPAYGRPSTLTTTTVSPLGRPALTGISLDPFVRAVDIPNLYVMPSGPLPPNPPELLDSKAMRRLLEALSDSGVEVVIFDTPPLLGLSDSSILASKADGTFVVIDITRAHKGNLRQVKTVLERAGAHVLGCVVNKQRRRRHDTLSYYYYLGTDEKNGKGSRSEKDAATATAVATGILKQSETPPRQDSPDRTVKIVPVPHIGVDTQSSQDVSNRETVKTTSIYPAESETQSRPDLLDGRKGG
jgi:Mrp family chromosome partitioning ATPase/capsular polysaccharide biosynthesis protein